MKILELFAGTRSIGKAFEARGHEVFSVEWDKHFEDIDLYVDIGLLRAPEVLERFGLPDVVWASPDCATFSVAAISYHRRLNKETKSLEPITDYAKFCDNVDQNVLRLIRELQQERERRGLPPLLYFIENPRGGMRKMAWMRDLPRYTVTYCQYGEERMKPTDIWTNHPGPKFKPACKNGDPCHVSAPRGSKTGTQALKGSKERSRIPILLCEHIVDICEEYINERVIFPVRYSVGSLFDGSGGFPLAGTLCGMEPRWASEVEPYPIAVTRSRFPHMKHLGDISKINGADIEPVDVITFGSPCQDLSVAGKQAGMKHESHGDSETTRSGLFIEAVRIIKEMRRATNDKYPQFAVWENVPGAFSSNKGEDFRTVLEEIVKVVDPSAPEIPAPEKGGWPYADCLVGDGWSIAYRTFDAQHWGVPQRRRRIYLVADFRGGRAEKALFEREGLRGYFTQSRPEREDLAAEAEESAGATDRAGVLTCDSQVNIDKDSMVQTLTSRTGTGGGNVPRVMEPFCKSSRGKFKGDAETWKPAEVSNTLNTFDVGEARANELVVMATQQGGAEIRTDGIAPTITAAAGMSGNNQPVLCLQGNGIDRADTAGCNGKGWREDVSYTLNTIDRPAVVYALDRSFFNQGQNALYIPQYYEDGTNPTLLAKGPSAVAHSIGLNGEHRDSPTLIARMASAVGTTQDSLIVSDYARYIVRRLTPTECARLQGFPDRWGDIDPKDTLTDEEHRFWLDVRNTHAEINGRAVKDYTKEQILTWYNKLHSDNAEYKMYGNGVALPVTLYVMQGIMEELCKA